VEHPVRFLLALLIAALAGGVGAAERADVAPSLLAYELKRLDVPEREALGRYRGRPVLMVFFEPECNWCFRQVRAVHALQERCPGNFQALAVGVNASRSGLKKELRRLRLDFPAFEASPALLESIGGGVPATPFTLIGDATGAYLGWTRGYLPEDALESFLLARGIAACPAGVTTAAGG